MRIIGAGMAGLLAAHMLRRHDPCLYEALPQLPDNHGALLRFRSNVVAEVTSQQFREVCVMKEMSDGYTNLAAANRYSIKVTGRAMPRSILNLDSVQRWIAPDDFLEVLAKGLSIQVNTEVDKDKLMKMIDLGHPIISTIPMGALMGMVPEWAKRVPVFPSTSIWSVRTHVEGPPSVDVHQTVYYPGPETYYRASITGNLLTVEFLYDPLSITAKDLTESLMWILAEDFGIDTTDPSQLSEPVVYFQELGKILPISEDIRREFILEMTDRYGIYSLGRFATWRQILLDDVVKDIRMIDKWISGRDSYKRRIEQ